MQKNRLFSLQLPYLSSTVTKLAINQLLSQRIYYKCALLRR